MPESKRAKPRPRFGQYRLTAGPDTPDFRDWRYAPSLRPLKRSIARPRKLHILDQGSEGACTGFGLAAAINLLNQRAGRRTRVSPWMLYEAARRHDEWPGHGYPGSSCRGAIKGWHNMGVCRESRWPDTSAPNHVTLERARDARSHTLGAYYRLEPRISDYHAALNETGVVFCSASVHDGWSGVDGATGRIPFAGTAGAGGHAFAIIGYDARGFLVQNSWGPDWGRNGTALWCYEDWQLNVMDAWVFSFALPTPQLWPLPRPRGSAASRSGRGRSPTRAEIAGHFVHLDDGDFHEHGRYWSDADDVRVTASYVAEARKYGHLLLYAHGGLNNPQSSARRIASMLPVFKANGIYPYHFMYDTGLMEELGDLIAHRGTAAGARAGGLADWTDRLIEWSTRVPGRALWREMKRGARLPFEAGRAGTQVLRAFLDTLWQAGRHDIKLHVAGHSTGGILLAHLLEALETIAPTQRIASCSLLAPAATLELFQSRYYPQLAADRRQCGIDKMVIYNLEDALERGDSVAVYRKSLLYLVSGAFEEQRGARLLGLERDAATLGAPRLQIVYATAAPNARSTSRSHGGFDNDASTMNDVLKTILRRRPRVPFTAETLAY